MTTEPSSTSNRSAVGWPARLTKARLHFVTGKGGTGVPVRTMFAAIEDVAANG